MRVVERILERFNEYVGDYGWSLDGSSLWEQQKESGKSYAEAKYDIVYALLNAIRDETREFNFIIDALPEDSDEVEFLLFDGDKVLGGLWYLEPIVLDAEYYRDIVGEIIEKLGMTE